MIAKSIHPAEQKKERPTPPAPQNAKRRMLFFTEHAKYYPASHVAAEMLRYQYHLTKGIRFNPFVQALEVAGAKAKSEIEFMKVHTGNAWKPMQALKSWIGNKFNPANRKLGMRGA